MTVLSSDLGRFVVMSALTMPSEAAEPSASMEQRALRAAWLDALAELGVPEEQARRAASEMRRQALTALMTANPFPASPKSGARP